MTEHFKLNNFGLGGKQKLLESVYSYRQILLLIRILIYCPKPAHLLYEKTEVLRGQLSWWRSKSLTWGKSGLKPRPVSLGPVLLPSYHIWLLEWGCEYISRQNRPHFYWQRIISLHTGGVNSIYPSPSIPLPAHPIYPPTHPSVPIYPSFTNGPLSPTWGPCSPVKLRESSDCMNYSLPQASV